jgi:hypothetical protein
MAPNPRHARPSGARPVLGVRNHRFSEAEDAELFALVSDAIELRDAGSPYFLDALEAIERWAERLPARRCERILEERADARRRRNDELIALLRETDPARIGSGARLERAA